MSSMVKPSNSKRSTVKSNSASNKRRKTHHKSIPLQQSNTDQPQMSFGNELMKRLCQPAAVYRCSSIKELLQYREYGVLQSRRYGKGTILTIHDILPCLCSVCVCV